MLVRRLGAGALCFLVVVLLVCNGVSSETGDKQLARVKGIVGYQLTASSAFKPIFGRFDLPDDAFAVTKPNAAAVLRLKDSSEIDIGENTKVQVGQFNAVGQGQNSIALNNGALHFNIRHPQGGQSNYRFVTATSQIAVRGTEGFLIAGVNGTQVVCVSCAAGDVTVQVGQQTVSVVTGQTLTVIGTNPLTATTTITSNASVNNPAVNQFNNNQSPFNANPSGTPADPTGSFSGAGTGAAGAGVGGVVTGVGAAAAVGGVVAATSNKGPNKQPGTLVVQIGFPGATTFPHSFNWPFNQNNATSNATFSCSPPSVITCSFGNQQISPDGLLSGTLSGTLNGPGQFQLGGNANGYFLPTTTFSVYGAVTVTSPAGTGMSFTQVPSTQQLVVNQLPAGTSLTASISCPGGASATLTPTSGPAPLTINVTANAAPSGNPPPAHACTITVTGQGDGPLAGISVPVDITSTGIGISSQHRRGKE